LPKLHAEARLSDVAWLQMHELFLQEKNIYREQVIIRCTTCPDIPKQLGVMSSFAGFGFDKWSLQLQKGVCCWVAEGASMMRPAGTGPDLLWG
jgi:hypothetical protein